MLSIIYFINKNMVFITNLFFYKLLSLLSYSYYYLLLFFIDFFKIINIFIYNQNYYYLKFFFYLYNTFLSYSNFGLSFISLLNNIFYYLFI